MTDSIPTRPARRELTEIDRQVIQWSIRLGTPDLDPNDPEGSKRRLVEEFHTWVAISPKHRQSFLEHYFWTRTVGADFAELEAVLRGDSGGPRALRVVTSGQNPATPLNIRKRGVTHTVALACAGVATVALVAWGVTAWLWIGAQTYTTGLGERHTFRLTDGSRVELNTLSEIKVWYSGSQRRVKLVQGEATFNVQHDTRRTFIVYSGSAEIRDQGTEFNVYQRQGPTRIAVIQGGVEVGTSANPLTLLTRHGDGRTEPIQLSAGEAVEVSGTRISDKSHPDMSHVTAWHEDSVVAVDEPLAELAAELNLHNRLKISVRGSEARAARMSGTFSTNDPGVFVKIVQASLNLPIHSTDDGWVIGDSP
jgi:transmembrane sensor